MSISMFALVFNGTSCIIRDRYDNCIFDGDAYDLTEFVIKNQEFCTSAEIEEIATSCTGTIYIRTGEEFNNDNK